MPQNLTDEKSTMNIDPGNGLVLSGNKPLPDIDPDLSAYDNTRPQWVNFWQNMSCYNLYAKITYFMHN